jgi:LysM repeat protein
VERICPFLALEGDRRTVVGVFDPEHRCHAVTPTLPLAREEQLTTCLIVEHRSCPRFLQAQEVREPRMAAWPAPAIDARLLSTRLVLGADAGRSRAGGRRPAATRWGLGAAAAVVGAAAVTASATGALDAIRFDAPPTDAAPPSATPRPTAVPAVGGPSPRPPVATATPSPTEAPTATPRPRRSPAEATPTPAPEPRTYVVQQGDTLAAIAARFGTSVEALQAANGIDDTDVILIGQVLVIP